MKNFWLERRRNRRYLAFEEAVYSHIYLTYGHARLTALTNAETKAIMPYIKKVAASFGYGPYQTMQLLIGMKGREKKWQKP
jgi:hypothetical protein